MKPSASSWIFEVTEENFETAVVERSHRTPVVLDFWAEWCGPCRALTPVLERLITARQGEVLLGKVNVEEAQALAQAFGINAIPAVKAIRGGQVILEFNGVLPEEHLRDFLDRIAFSPAETKLQEAQKLETENPAKAETLYRQILAQEPTLDAARVGLARLLVAAGKDTEVPELLDPVGVEGELGAEAQRLLSVLSLKHMAPADQNETQLRAQLQREPENAELRYELGCALAKASKHKEALEMLLSAGERDFKLASGKVREAMVQIFYAIGQAHPLADEYRSKLARLLY